jgi:hypothetical protein
MKQINLFGNQAKCKLDDTHSHALIYVPRLSKFGMVSFIDRNYEDYITVYFFEEVENGGTDWADLKLDEEVILIKNLDSNDIGE